ncbi:SusC/RagA family TonB-linked outer membrane protein [Chitinophaga niabensis]|uniref:TonB-linked outer membrane protein, SusC/RagA family n=1 Tax=Chitinophaga niabensis TaxID=536979 RepID=A0A1N6GJD9_9BACT|nr:SusC/RagA family TonB-linked outer membrane protein [Chitinophaga niabensis]SIO07614.1 TonB-linked outer membrane protein, SusC/RagA family [Chitinophaga niabensis]
MKLTTALLLLTTLQVTAYEGNSQNKVSVDFRNTQLTRALKEVERKTDYRFVFSNLVLNEGVKVTVDARNVPVLDLLSQMLNGTGLVFDKLGENLVVIKKEETPLGEITVKGKITDRTGLPLPGVSIVSGPGKGTISNEQGEYTIRIDEKGTLTFSFIGYTPQAIPINGRTSINVTLLESKDTELNEVVVVGYGTMNKRDLTGAVTKLGQEDLIAGSVSPLMAIQGKVPGLTVISTNGTDPNAGVSLQLRGVNSINAAQGPLVVIDGIPGGNINTVVKEDIESISVLRDASAAAIYGTRASGGVILITTKKAKAGMLRASFTSELFLESIRKRPESLTAEEFVANKVGTDLGHKTDWYKEVTNKSPFSQRYVFNVNGGTENAQVYASFMTRNATGMAIESKRKEYSGRMNTYFRFFNGVAELSTNISYTQANATFSDNGIFNMALTMNPTETPYNSNDVTGYNIPVGGFDYFNPIAEVKLRKDLGQYKNLLASSTLKLNITKNLYASGMIALKNDTEHKNFYRSSQHRISRNGNIDGNASQSYSRWDDRTLELTLNYNKNIGHHYINAVGGYTYQDFNGQGFSANNSNFPVDGIQDNDMGTGTWLADGRAGIGSWKNPTVKLIAFFGRVNYSYRDRYILTASLRREGSSKFAKGNQWGSFPGISAAWRISEENFLKNSNLVSTLKLRGGYGATGNEGFSANVATRMYGADTWWLVDGEWLRTYGVLHNQNPNIRWEVKKEYNVGLDFGLLGDRINGRIDFYKRRVDDMIYDVSVSQPPAIHDKTSVNVGNMENKGFEFELNWNAIKNTDWNYTTGIIASANRSTLTTLNGGQTFSDRKSFPAPGNPGTAVRLYPGEDIGRFFIWRFAGFTDAGNWMLYDKTGKPFDVKAQAKKNEDKVFVGNAIPKIILSWNHTLSWKNFDAGIYMRSWIGHDVFNMINMYYSLPNVSGQNVLRDAFDKHKNIKGEKELSDYWLEKGTFLKLDAFNIGYTFPAQTVAPFKGLRLYVTARDLFVLTNYSGLDPEVNINGLEPGFEERNVYPKTRTFMFGLQASF